MKKDFIYRCSKECPINKKCFVIKVEEIITQPLKIKQKCRAYKKDIVIKIDDKSNDVVIEKEDSNG